MTGNETSRRCWAYQASVGAEAINAAGDTTYLFGFPDKSQKWKVPKILTDIEAYHNYASREPTALTPIDPIYKTFFTPAQPTTAQYLAWMLKQVTEDGVGANVHEVEVLDSGLPLPLTIRFGLLDGTVDRIFQAVDCYSVGLTCSATFNRLFLVENEWAFGRLEDRRGQWIFDDLCDAVNVGAKTIDLTTTGGTLNQYANYLVFVNGGDEEDDEYTVASNTAATPTVLTISETPGTDLAADTLSIFDKLRPKLTTAPVMPGQTAVNAFMGTPEVYWDAADQNVQLTECWNAVWSHKQNFSQVLDVNQKYAITYLYKHEPITLTLDMICEKNKQVYDYIDRKANQINIKVYKPDTTYYILHKLSGCEIIDWVETGHANKGHYNAKVLLKAASCVGNFTHESETNWSTHYKTV